MGRDFAEISATNGRLQDLRDGTTRLRKFYSDLWLSESLPYWLPNVQVRYDRLALIFTDKIADVQAALAKSRSGPGATLPPPEQLGFYNPIAPPPPQSRPGTVAPAPPAATPPAQTITPPAAQQPPATTTQPSGVPQVPPTQPKPEPPPSQKPPE